VVLKHIDYNTKIGNLKVWNSKVHLSILPAGNII
jgi:hypothetical protein